MKENASDRLKNFLVNGIGTSTRQDDVPPDQTSAEIRPQDIDLPAETVQVPEPVPETEPTTEAPADLAGIESELREIRRMLEDISAKATPDLSQYMTTREQSKAMNATVAKLEASASNKTLVNALEQICAMREDFFKLCEGMRGRIDELDASTVLSSFQAYEVDMENILVDSGVYIGHFDFPKLNTLHQRIVGVVPTDDKEKDGTVAERLSDGYKLADKVLLKERVVVYKFDPSLAAEAETPSDAPAEQSAEEIADEAPVQEAGAEAGGPASEEVPSAPEETASEDAIVQKGTADATEPDQASQETVSETIETTSETSEQTNGENNKAEGMEEQE